MFDIVDDMSIVRLSFPVFLQPTTKLFIDGKFVESSTSEWLDIHNPVSVNAYTHTPQQVYTMYKPVGSEDEYVLGCHILICMICKV